MAMALLFAGKQTKKKTQDVLMERQYKYGTVGEGESILPTSDSTLMQASTDAFWTGLSQLQW